MRWGALAALAVLAVACEDSGGGQLPVKTDSESHWLMACTEAADCAGLACVCGVCTRACGDAGRLDLGAPPVDGALPAPDAAPTDGGDAAPAVDGGPPSDAAPVSDAGHAPDAGGCEPGPDTCVQDPECADGDVCVTPAGHGVRNSMCVRAACTVDADCVDHPEGRCTPFLAPCRELGFFCTYAVDPCRTDADCPDRGAPKVCEPIEGGAGTQCVDAP